MPIEQSNCTIFSFGIYSNYPQQASGAHVCSAGMSNSNHHENTICPCSTAPGSAAMHRYTSHFSSIMGEAQNPTQHPQSSG